MPNFIVTECLYYEDCDEYFPLKNFVEDEGKCIGCESTSAYYKAQAECLEIKNKKLKNKHNELKRKVDQMWDAPGMPGFEENADKFFKDVKENK